ncbi:MAG: TIGR00282 family metallophosphoesterase [Acholeplasmataceae bacterium]
MRIIFVGDLYGQVGIDTFLANIVSIKTKYQPHLIIVNGENANNGRGINLKIYKSLMKAGVAAVTMGNWVWGTSELFTFIDESNIVRPINYRNAPGTGALTIKYNDQKILIINALGRTFMNPNVDCPFQTIQKAIEESDADYKILDFHAEATSEKVAIGHYFDGKIDLIVGTHTHIQTADERVLPRGTLYITDVGMTGPVNGVIGVKQVIVINRFLNGFSIPNEVAGGPMQLNAIFADLRLKKIERVHIEEQGGL